MFMKPCIGEERERTLPGGWLGSAADEGRGKLR